LKKEKPDAPIEELVKEADAIVANEMEERRKARESSTNAVIEEKPEEAGEEVTSKSEE